MQSRLLLLLIVCAALLTTGARAFSLQELPKRARLTNQERRGKTIYQFGETVSGRPIIARLGEIEVAGNTLPCAGCHGVRGEGLTEGGVTADELRWPYLTNAVGHVHKGRKHKSYDEQSVVRATADCIDPSGNKLQPAMPCYGMAPSDFADLIAYLKRLDTDRDPGITDAKITVATVVPANGALAELGAAMRAALTAYFDDINAHGGLLNRRIELRVVEAGSTPAETADRVRALTGNDEPFVVVGGMTAGADAELNEAANALQVPFIGPATLTPSPNSRYVYYIFSGVSEQSKALVVFAARMPQLQRARVLVIASDGILNDLAAKSVEEQAKTKGFRVANKHTYTQTSFAVAPIIDRLKADTTDVIFFFGPVTDLISLLKQAAAEKLTPTVFLLGAMSGGTELIKSMPVEFKDKVFLSFPTVPSDITPTALEEYRALQTAARLPSGHVAAQISAVAAGKIFVEAVGRAGKDVTRVRLLSMLDGMSNFETGLSPPLTFAPNQHIGALGAYIIKVDVENKNLVAASGWISGK